MYSMCKEKCIEYKEPFAKLHLYNRIFQNEFNILFVIPKKDQCLLCEARKSMSGSVMKENEQIFLKHDTEKKLSREEKEKDVELAKMINALILSLIHI